MPKGRQLVFSYQGLAEALVKQQGFRAGPWGTNAEFETGAAGVNNAPGVALVTAPSFLPQGRPLRGTTKKFWLGRGCRRGDVRPRVRPRAVRVGQGFPALSPCPPSGRPLARVAATC